MTEPPGRGERTPTSSRRGRPGRSTAPTSNPLRVFWRQLWAADQPPGRVTRPLASGPEQQAAIFLVLRRMRAPLITLIVIFTVSVVGLALMPGVDPTTGQPQRLTPFDAFYVVSYTATTIGFGELPVPFTTAQRMWVTFVIYLSVVGWAYAIGTLLSLLQDRSFRAALARQRFGREVARLREPFLLVAGFGRAGELLGRSLDDLGQQFVVLDAEQERIDALDLSSFHQEIPGLAGDVADPQQLARAGLDSPYCVGVVALTDDDEVNLAVTMAATLLRPDIPVVARTTSRAVGRRIQSFGRASIINPFDRFGDHLRVALRAPATFQLITWLQAGPGAPLPPRSSPPTSGRWIICGYGRFGREMTIDLTAEGLEVTVIEPRKNRGQDPAHPAPGPGSTEIVHGDGSEPDVLAEADLHNAVGFVAGTDNDTTNLWMLAAARSINPHLFLAGRQNRPANAPLYAAMDLDSLLVPAETVAHEVYAQLSTPLLWRFLQEVPGHDNAWSEALIERLTTDCGRHLPALWPVRLTPDGAPALTEWLDSGTARLGQLLRDPDDRDARLPVVPLILVRGRSGAPRGARRAGERSGEAMLAPGDDVVLHAGDELLFAGHAVERRELEGTLAVEATREYVVTGRQVPASWIWRKLTRTPPSPPGR